MQTNDKILVLGAEGMVGRAITRELYTQGYQDVCEHTRKEADLTSLTQTLTLFEMYRPDYVFMCAAKVGGIEANRSQTFDFLQDNLAIQKNVFEAAHLLCSTKMLFLGSSCIYPRNCPQPMKEGYLGTGPLEETNKSYAMAKLCGVQACQAHAEQFSGAPLFVPVLPTNLYGPYDNFDLYTSHVLPAMIRKVHTALMNDYPTVELWGTGQAYREFMHVRDCARGCVELMKHYGSYYPINLGTGVEGPIWELAQLVCDCLGYEGQIKWDASKPDGTPRKRLDTTRLVDRLPHWTPTISLRQGIRSTYEWAIDNDWNRV